MSDHWPSASTAPIKDGTVTLRGAREDDAQALFDLLVAVVADGEGQVLEPDELQVKSAEDERAWIADMNAAPRNLALVACEEGVVVGLVDVKVSPRRRLSHHGRIGLCVAASHRNRGIGRALLEGAIAWAKAHPALEKLELAVLADNPRAIALYRKLGFEEEGRRRGYIRRGPDDVVDDLIMGLML